MDFTYYRDIIADQAYVDVEPPQVAVAGAINSSFNYWSGLNLAIYEMGAGQFILNTLNIHDKLSSDPVAERIMRNMLNYATAETSSPPHPLPDDFDDILAERGL